MLPYQDSARDGENGKFTAHPSTMRGESINEIGHEAMHRRRFLRLVAGAAPLAIGLTHPWHSLAASSGIDDLSFLKSRVSLMPRAAWTQTAPMTQRLERSPNYTRITVHHAGASISTELRCEDIAMQIEGIMEGHRKRRFGDIGYHFVIDRAGRVWEGRSLKYTGAHVSAQNQENIGVMLLGNFERQRPAPKQLDSLHELTQALRNRFTVPRYRVFGHRDLGQTLCPGRYLYGTVGALRGA